MPVVGQRGNLTLAGPSVEKVFQARRLRWPTRWSHPCAITPRGIKSLVSPEPNPFTDGLHPAQFVLWVGAGGLSARGGADHGRATGHLVFRSVQATALTGGAPPEGSCMRYYLAACLLGLGLGVALGLLLAILGETWTSLDFHAPAALVQRATNRVRSIHSYVFQQVRTANTVDPAEDAIAPARLSREHARPVNCGAC